MVGPIALINHGLKNVDKTDKGFRLLVICRAQGPLGTLGAQGNLESRVLWVPRGFGARGLWEPVDSGGPGSLRAEVPLGAQQSMGDCRPEGPWNPWAPRVLETSVGTGTPGGMRILGSLGSQGNPEAWEPLGARGALVA
jgi:hypothetical protein